MASSERTEPAWIAHETNAILLRLAEKLEVDTSHLKSTLKKVAGEWTENPQAAGCPQSAYLKHCVTQAALAGLFYPAIEPLLQKGQEQNVRVQLVRAILDESPRPNDWSSLQNDLWGALDMPKLPAEKSEEAAAKLEVLESERILIDAPGGVLTALRPAKEGAWPVYRLDATSFRKEADDLVEWLSAQVGGI